MDSFIPSHFKTFQAFFLLVLLGLHSTIFSVTVSPHLSKNQDAVEVFYFPDESQKTNVNVDRSYSDSGNVVVENPEMTQTVLEEEEAEDDWDEEFCILEEETGNGIPVRVHKLHIIKFL